MTDANLAALAIIISCVSLIVSVLTPIISPVVARKLRERREAEDARRYRKSRQRIEDHLTWQKERETARIVTDSTNYGNSEEKAP